MKATLIDDEMLKEDKKNKLEFIADGQVGFECIAKIDEIAFISATDKAMGFVAGCLLGKPASTTFTIKFTGYVGEEVTTFLEMKDTTLEEFKRHIMAEQLSVMMNLLGGM